MLSISIVRLFCIILQVFVASFHINFDQTDDANHCDNCAGLRHHCLHVPSRMQSGISHQLLSYCLSEWPAVLAKSEYPSDLKFTFADLYERHVTSENLYIWSAPMDVVERYHLYSNERSRLKQIQVMNTDVFYNCTVPRFGSQCQYSLDSYEPKYSSLHELVYDFYSIPYTPTSLTCYEHLECECASASICLAWHEICDGIVHCLNNAIDELHCWKLRLNECEADEFQCSNGQCISRIFHQDDRLAFECLDRSDQDNRKTHAWFDPHVADPTFLLEDIQFSMHSDYEVHYSSVVKRLAYLKKLIFSSTPNSMVDECWDAFRCYYNIRFDSDQFRCQMSGLNFSLLEMIDRTCPSRLIIPSTPILFSHIYFAYDKERIVMNSNKFLRPHYICFDARQCYGFYFHHTPTPSNASVCKPTEKFHLSFTGESPFSTLDFYVQLLTNQLRMCNPITHSEPTACRIANMYLCVNSSRCIFAHQLCDRIKDCPFEDDEQCALNNGTCSNYEHYNLFKCSTTNQCLSLSLINDLYCHCEDDDTDLCDDEKLIPDPRTDLIPFSAICDGFTQFPPALIDGRNETDETACEHWQCDNAYTRCNHRWNCFDGRDEINCGLREPSDCPRPHHRCVSSQTYQFTCLPFEKLDDGHIDCVGATDELKLCRLTEYRSKKNFLCNNNSTSTYSCIQSSNLCAENSRCPNGEDARLCNPTQNSTHSQSICRGKYSEIRSEIQTFFCERNTENDAMRLENFALHEKGVPGKQAMDEVSNTPSTMIIKKKSMQQRCHRGLPLSVVSVKSCLCPPSYYGSTCQYENERVSLTLKFQVFSDSRRTLFTFIVSLMDDERLIYSYQQHSYLYLRDCHMRYNIYLLYPTRPRQPLSNYSIHIDVFEKISLAYRSSYFIPIKYNVLPVHRLAIHLTIPRRNDDGNACFDQSCHNGRCVQYANDRQRRSFCRCHQGWTGRYCTVRHLCQCAPDSSCAGVSAANQSVCVCPVNRWGRRCLLENNICQSTGVELCANAGQCVPIDEHLIRSQKFFCICRKGYRGEKCELQHNNLTLTFNEDIPLSSSLTVHFIDISLQSRNEVNNGSIVQVVPYNQRTIVIYYSNRFHIAFVQLARLYYLLIVQPKYNPSNSYDVSIAPSDRCRHISEVLDTSVVSFHRFRRMKYFQIPCQNDPQLKCFYDDYYFCICYRFNNESLSNCFNFYSELRPSCAGLSECENNGECFQDKLVCPQSSICLCPECFHGSRCQFNSRLSSLSLDSILNYHLRPSFNLSQQPAVVQFTLGATILITLLGFLNGFLSFSTYKTQEVQKTGCGFYLLFSSIITLLTMIIFLAKVSVLFYTQINYTTNQIFLKAQCYTLDFLLRFCLTMDQYLQACVAIERAMTVIKGTSFSKNRSREIAKYIVSLIMLWIIGTTIIDPIHRRLFEEKNEDDENSETRIWCLVTYSSTLQIFHRIVHLVHFFIPFLSNIISAVIIIFLSSRQRNKSKKDQSYGKIFRNQLKAHMHILISPIVLILLAIPRLILTFLSDCMKSTDDIWIPLVGYLISFFPPMITFLLVVFPSEHYKEQFHQSMRKIQRFINIRLNQQ